MDINKVLVTDAVDAACVDLLKNNSIQVDCKFKLPKDQLLAEIQVRISLNCFIHLINNCLCLEL